MLKYRLLNHQPQARFLIVLIFTSLLLTTITLFNVHTYDTISVTGINNCNEKCETNFTIGYDNASIINSSAIISYKNVIYPIENIVYGEPYIAENTIYEDITITTPIYSDNKLITFKILNNRQRIITKLKNIILER